VTENSDKFLSELKEKAIEFGASDAGWGCGMGNSPDYKGQ
jgi:hypothetical protein